MNLKQPELKIDQTGDVFSNDMMNRKPEIERLSKLVMNISDPIVLALDAPWGSGKSSFIKLWKAHLGREACFELNAWETDFSNDPLIAMVHQFQEWENEQKSIYKKHYDNLKKAALPIAKQALVAGTKIATLGILNLDQAQKEVLAELAGSYASEAFDQFEDAIKAMNEFKKTLVEIRSQLDSNLVIIVDELDRCRPTYAIEVLERIKHLFNIPGIVFVLSIDKTQFAHSIKAVYGNEFESTAYLTRFIDLTYSPEKITLTQYIHAMLKDSFFDVMREEKHLSRALGHKSDFESFHPIFTTLSKHFNCTPREVNQILLEFKIAMMSETNCEFTNPHLTILLLLLRRKKNDLYKNYFITHQAINDIKSTLAVSGLSNEYKALYEALLYRGWYVSWDKSIPNRNSGGLGGRAMRNEDYIFNIITSEYARRESDPFKEDIRKRIEFGASLIEIEAHTIK